MTEEEKKLKTKKKKLLFIFSAAAISLVFLGWFFSFHHNWREENFSFSGWGRIDQFKDGVKEISSNFKDNATSASGGLGANLEAAVNSLREIYQRQKEVKDIVGEKMKENLSAQTNNGSQ
jgi:hypothetical protein